jgi:endonuclease G
MINLKHALTTLLLAAALTALSSPATAASPGFQSCPQFFPGNTPRLPEGTRHRVRELCFDAFAVLHSGSSKTPVYAVERLSREQLDEARDEVRSNRFYPEARLRAAERATLADYKGSGFDRGHMAPAADMPSAQAMAQSFSLANMVPQAPENNRGVWAKAVEKSTRQYVKRVGRTVYIFTGPVFSNRPQTIGEGKVWVPAYLYKLVYDPKANRAWAHWIQNSAHARAGQPISYRELVERTGIDFLPGITPDS